MPVRPAIAAIDFEFDSRPSQENPIVTWEDTSGQGNDATGVGSPDYEDTGWRPEDRAFGAVRLREAVSEHFTFDGSGMVGTDLTVFLVVDCIDIGPAPSGAGVPMLGGSTTGTNLGMLQVGVGSAGQVVFAFFDTGSGVNDVVSGNGLVDDGDRIILACRHSSVTAKILRLDGTQIASNTGTDHIASWADPFIGRIQAAFFGIDKKIAWISAHRVAASDAEIEQMERWLAQEFGAYSTFPVAPRPTRVSDLWSPGALKDVSPSGLIQLRATKAVGWSWEQTWGLLNVGDAQHMSLLTFIEKGWNRGDIFNVAHPLVPGSGRSPKGLGTVGILVKGASQTGDTLVTDGWPVSTTNVARAGDVIRVSGDTAVYVVTVDATSDVTGTASLVLSPQLRRSPADNAAVTTTDVGFRVSVVSRSQYNRSRSPLYFEGISVVLSEALA